MSANDMSNAANHVVLIDTYTRNASRNIAFDAILNHATILTDIRELSDEYYGSHFVFFESAAPAIVTPEIVAEMKSLYGIKPHLIYTINDVGLLFSDICDTVKADYTSIEWNLIYAVINADSAILEPYQRINSVLKEFSDFLSNMPVEYSSAVNRMYFSYLKLASDYRELVTENSRLKDLLSNYKGLGRRAMSAVDELQSILDKVVDQNNVYSAQLSETSDKVCSGVYGERPRILYFKSISHLSGIDSLLSILYSVLVKQYRVSCKVLKLVDSANAVSVRYVPNSFVPITDNYSTDEILTNDFIMNLGGYSALMSFLLLNRSGLNYLIIHDMRGTMNCALNDSLIDLKIYEMSGDRAVLGEYENTITELPNISTFSWDFREVSSYTGTSSVKLVNHPTVVSILDRII